MAILVSELQEAEKVKNEAEEVVAKGQMKLGLAERLLGALSSENVRWCAGIESLGTSRALLVGDTLLSAAFISYIGPFTKQYRTKLLESLGESFGITAANHKFVNISMGQGQEAPAEAMLEKMAHDGGWVMLQNLHLMQSWLPVLERKLEVCSEHAHQDFRCYVSAEAPSFSYQRNIPESLLQSCIKVSNEAPSDIKSNIERAWAPFPQC